MFNLLPVKTFCLAERGSQLTREKARLPSMNKTNDYRRQGYVPGGIPALFRLSRARQIYLIIFICIKAVQFFFNKLELPHQKEGTKL